MTTFKDYLYKKVPEAIFLEDEYDDALIGVCISSKKAIYSLKKCTEINMQKDKSEFSMAYIQFIFMMFKRQNEFPMPIFCLDFQLSE